MPYYGRIFCHFCRLLGVLLVACLGCSSREDPSPAIASEAPGGAGDHVPRRLELTFVGDVIFGRYRDPWFDPIDPEQRFDYLREVRPALRSDLLVINLETPVVESLPRRSPLPEADNRFGASRAMVAAHLVPAGVAVASLANNHFYDLREEGQRESPRILRELGIAPVGASQPTDAVRVETLERNGYRIGFVAFTTRRNVALDDLILVPPFVAPEADCPELLDRVAEATADHDLVVVLAH
ncbi:MAG: CapA family protein, partial [Myxococcota bacterium]